MSKCAEQNIDYVQKVKDYVEMVLKDDVLSSCTRKNWSFGALQSFAHAGLISISELERLLAEYGLIS